MFNIIAIHLHNKFFSKRLKDEYLFIHSISVCVHCYKYLTVFKRAIWFKISSLDSLRNIV